MTNNSDTESRFVQGRRECANPFRSDGKPPSRLQHAQNSERESESYPLYMSLFGEKVIKSG